MSKQYNKVEKRSRRKRYLKRRRAAKTTAGKKTPQPAPAATETPTA
jgi:hypothetical protein